MLDNEAERDKQEIDKRHDTYLKKYKTAIIDTAAFNITFLIFPCITIYLLIKLQPLIIVNTF